MRDILLVLVHSIVTVVRLIKPGGLRAVVAESALTRHQLLILNRSRKRAPNLRVSDRMIAGLCTLHPAPNRQDPTPRSNGNPTGRRTAPTHRGPPFARPHASS